MKEIGQREIELRGVRIALYTRADDRQGYGNVDYGLALNASW